MPGASAFASPPDGEAKRVAATADSATIAEGQPASRPAESGLQVAISGRGDHAVTLTSDTVAPARITLPKVPGDAVGTPVDGKRVFQAADRTHSVVAEPVTDGARGLAVINNTAAPSRYSFKFDLPPGGSLVPLDDGSVAVQVAADGAALQVGQIAPAWARDATGKRVPTRYEVSGSTLTQVVEHQGASYPVVADPKLTYGRGVYLNLWGWEGNAIGAVLGALIGAGGFVGCNVANVSGVPGTIVKIICNAGAGKNAVGILRGLGARNLAPGWCYQNLILPSSGGWRPVDAKNCR